MPHANHAELRVLKKAQILDAAIAVMKKTGLFEMKRSDIADQANVANGSINFYFDDMESLREAMVEHAMALKDGEALALLVSTIKYRQMMAPSHLRLACKHITG